MLSFYLMCLNLFFLITIEMNQSQITVKKKLLKENFPMTIGP